MGSGQYLFSQRDGGKGFECRGEFGRLICAQGDGMGRIFEMFKCL